MRHLEVPSVANFKPLTKTVKTLIESKMFMLANTMLNGVIYNVHNTVSLHREVTSMIKTKEKNSYIIFVESNGNGHVTQMKHIIELLKDTFKCVGIVIGREKKMASEFASKHNIPIVNLHEPKYVSNKEIDVLVRDTIAYTFEYSCFQYSKIADFVVSKSPEFIVNLHLPIKLMCAVTRPVFHISTQNRLDFDTYYNSVVSHGKFEKFTTHCVMFTNYLIHKSHLNLYKIAIDCVPNMAKNVDLTIPPLIDTFDVSLRLEKCVVCYFNIVPDKNIYNVMSLFPHISFHVYMAQSINTGTDIVCDNVYIHDVGKDFDDKRKNCLGLITSCGVETVYENFLLGLPMICIPSNSEQLFNAYDHSRKIPGFTWTFQLKQSDIEWLVNFEYTHDYWCAHEKFKTYMATPSKLVAFIQDRLH